MVDSSGHASAVEVLLVDVSQVNRELENRFKFDLYQRFGLQSDRYESTWDYLQYLRLAEPAYEALQALLGDSPGPHFVLSHEYMGMPLALKSISAADPRFHTIFHAHEVAAVRPIVENAPGHDAMFYNVMALAMDAGLSIGDVFGDQSGNYRHALVERSHRCDSVFAVGDRIVDELRFLGPGLRDAPIDLVYNGVPAVEISAEEKKASVDRLRSYAEALTGVRPQVVFTHVSRPVASKGFWRDLQILEHLDRAFAAAGRSGVLYLLSTAAGSRSPEDVRRMEAEYGWPLDHRAGYPDLEGPEVDLWSAASAFNQRARAIRVVFVNQFGWDRGRCGRRMPAGDVLRRSAQGDPGGVRPLHLRALRNRPGGAAVLRRPLRGQRRVRMPWIRQTGGGRTGLCQPDRRRLHGPGRDARHGRPEANGRPRAKAHRGRRQRLGSRRDPRTPAAKRGGGVGGGAAGLWRWPQYELGTGLRGLLPSRSGKGGAEALRGMERRAGE